MSLVYLVVLALMIVALSVFAAAMAVYGYFSLRNRVPYVVLPDGAFAEVIQALGVRDSDAVYDLGCGDGRVIVALQKHKPHARYLGVENNWLVWLMARWKLRGKARLMRGEIAGTPLGEATRVFAYLGPQMMAELEPRFERELPKGARVVSVQFPLPHRAADETFELKNSASHASKMYVYNY